MNSVAPHGPRHARVLPSFAVAFVARPLDCSVGTVDSRELLAWRRPGLPSSGTASDLRAQFVKRRRASFDAIWNARVNVKIVEDWRRALIDDERLRLLPLLRNEDAINAFPQLTLRAVKDALRMRVADTLGVLAKLEALYWVPTPWRRAPSARIETLADVSIDAEFVEYMRARLASPWIDALESDDLRFPGIDGQKLAVWIVAQLERPVLSGPAHDLCVRLLAADKASWADELADLVIYGIEHADPRPGSDEAKQRWIGIFLARYGGPRGLELQTVGDRFGITRERVRQICDAVLVSLRAQPVKMPALERLLSAAARVMPLPMEEADTQLTRFLGDGCGLQAAMQFAEVMGLPSPVRQASPLARTHAGYKPVSIVEAASAPATWVSAALVHARRDCTFVGCTNFIRIAGLLALEQGVAQDLETLRAVFSKAPGFRLLDAESGWFTLADSESSAAASRMRKLMSVVAGSVDIDTVASALMTDDKWFYREGGRALAVPPLHVLAELFSGWNWLTANSHNKYTAKIQLDPKTVLSKTELGAIEALEMHGGAATRAELAAHLMGTLGVSNMAVSQVVATSSALWKLDHAIYGIRGRALPAEALVEARKRRMAEQLASLPAAEFATKDVDLSAPVRTMVTQSASAVAANLRVVYLPSYLSGKVAGVFKHVGMALPDISVKANNQIRKLAKVAEALGIGPGERFEIVFDVPGGTYAIPGVGPHGADAPAGPTPSVSGVVQSGSPK
ncbi:sigma factor-like helix-turn-helix DNA-binding protein [Pseudorhodoferax sp.]|uniref:sigma factor-like helix-turn-helix DNA-binding protein n=1 Tax=Pseudorhodoferax sp. TaxID=1993553 RepID=UPI002DD627B8|nr:sigma factor-like helix-turn-helix DNA-binding protein [Pseudorhodoferax sp.]